MNEISIRAIESAVAGARPEPIAPTLPLRGTQGEAPSPSSSRTFTADVPFGEDAWGLEGVLRPLAELIAHRDTEAPLTIGCLGGPGSGKSFALGALIGQIDGLARASADRGVFLKRIAIVRVDGARLDGDASVTLAGLIYEALGRSFPDLVRDAADAVRDPRAMAREAADRLDDARRRLDSERQSLAEIENRRARIFETVLFETAGSKIDACARANRASIESRLEGFGITGEPILNFKSMVRDLAESGGSIARAGAALRALWAFKGQTRLLVTAAVLGLAGLGLSAAVVDQATWLGWLQSTNESLAPTVAWIRAQIGWLTSLKQIAYGGAAAALALAILRASRFMQPLFRGVALLESDVAAKRHDIDGLYAHQMRRVDGLTAEVDRIAHRAAQADRRAGNHVGGADEHLEPSPFETGSLKLRAERFFVSLGGFLQRPDRGSAALADLPKATPERIVVALDNLDALAPEAACAVLEATHRALAQPGFVLLLALDSARLFEARSEIEPRLEKWIQVPFRVGPDGTKRDVGCLVAQILGRRTDGEREPGAVVRDGADWTISDVEAALLAELAPIAGTSPRAVKRFVNLYRVIRTQAPEIKTELALMLALDLGGTDAERSAVASVLAEEADEADLDLAQFGPRIAGSLHNATTPGLKVGALRRAAAIVWRYSLRG
ncbi:MAG: P-loop NTPase fold protein [Beijerinckiaceae bacterium]